MGDVRRNPSTAGIHKLTLARFKTLMGVDISYFQIPWYREYRATKVGFRGSKKPGRWRNHLPKVLEVILSRREKDPVVLFENVMKEIERFWHPAPNPKAPILRKMPMNGPWHHAIVPAVLIAALRNNGYPFTDEHISEAFHRGSMIPEGSCGFLGACGTAIGIGVAVSIVSGATPYHGEERSLALKHTGEMMVELAKEGGPRCSKLSSYLTILHAVRVFKEEFGYELPVPSPEELQGRCPFWTRNPTCHLVKCRFNPLTRRMAREKGEQKPAGG